MQKLLLPVLFLLISGYAQSQQHYFIPRLNYVSGKGVQAGKFSAGGLGLQFESFKDVDSKIGWLISGETNLSGSETRSVSLNFAGSNASTDVNYYSSMNKITGGGIYVPLNGAFVSPYMSLQGGVAWYRTKLTIEDPDDPSACSPVQTKNVKLSLSLISNLESGVKVRLTNNKKKMVFLQAGVGYNIGTKASYIKLGEEANDETTQAYNSKFKMSNGQVHEHPIGTMYRTGTSQLVYNLGVSISFE